MAMVFRSPSSSSSMSSSHPYSFSYDVFLSFRGEDTRMAFTDHLYTALKQAGIRTFRDDDAMERGRLLKPELEKAIQQSQVSLIVFSESYATSKWCLDEVLMIMEEYERSSSNKREVVPVFYNIDPTHVRNQTGCFQEAFDGYDDEVRRETDAQKKMELLEKVEAWRSSLRKAGSLTGMVLAKDGYEAKFISNIVNVIRKKVNYNALYIKGKLVGMKEDVAKIESWLQDQSPNSTILIIDGMGGIGKTTIAKCVYNMNCCEYDGCCFLANINATSNHSNGMLRLQSQLLSTFLKSEKEETIWNQDEGTIKVANAMCNKKVLIVLDDVATLQQLDTLLGPQRFYPGSKVIITTRHTWLSTAFTVHYPKVQTIAPLFYPDSTKLFCLYAFHQDQPIEAYIDQLEQAIHYCEGLPLALEVLGSNLHGKSIVEWKDAMCKLEKNPLPGIQNVLQLSYESLDDNDKDVFLHIACFFVREDKDYVLKLLAECNLHPIIGIKNLRDRCLLDDAFGEVQMHQLIREMGQEVVRQESPKDPGKRSRLWEHEDCINVLQENAGTEKVEGLMLDMQNIREPKRMDNPRKHSVLASNFKIGALEKMKNLMLLQLNYVTFSEKYEELPKKLRLLRWHGFFLKCMPGDIPLEKLVVLDMSYSKLKHVWDNFKIIKSLQILNLSYSVELKKTPHFGGLPGLESLILKGCIGLTKVHESIAYLKELVLLDLTDCRSLRNIPYLPRSLVSLQMSGCPYLGAVRGFRCLESISLASLLEDLDISNCNVFDNSFPNDWSNLVLLKKLRIDGNNVTYLPKCIQSLPRLEHLSAENCSHIQSVRGLPEALRVLSINNNISLEKVEVPIDNNISVYSSRCPKLCGVEGWYKWQSIDKVERKVIQNLGLGMELGLDYSNKQKVAFEYGIFSTFVTEEQIPSSFTYKERGPQISFIVPSSSSHHHPNSRRISGFNLSLALSPIFYSWLSLRIEVYNKTKDLKWNYFPGSLYVKKVAKKGWWLSVWRCGNLLDNEDQIFVRIFDGLDNELRNEVEECCINLIYDDDDENNIKEEAGRKEEGNDNVVSEYDNDEIRWSDRMLTDISHYVHTHMTYSFGYDRALDYDVGFFSGHYWKIYGERREESTSQSKSGYRPTELNYVPAQSMKSPTMVTHLTAQILCPLVICCFLFWVFFKWITDPLSPPYRPVLRPT